MKIQSWGARRTYSNAYLNNEYDGDCIGEEIIREMLNIMSFDSIQNFNNIVGGFNEGHIPPLIENKGLEPFEICMKEEYKISENPIECYREYYIKDKVRFAKWKNGNVPSWWHV